MKVPGFSGQQTLGISGVGGGGREEVAFLLRLSCQPSAGSERRYVCPWEGDRSWSAQVRAMLLVWEDKLAGENLERLSRQEGGREGGGRDRIGELRWAERTEPLKWLPTPTPRHKRRLRR